MIHTVKGFGIVNEAVDVFLELSYFFSDPMDVGKLISGLIYFAHLNIYINIGKIVSECYSLNTQKQKFINLHLLLFTTH